jgi:hypothetical protein
METLDSKRYCSIYISYELVGALAKVTQFPSKRYPVHSQLARRMGRGEGHPLVGNILSRIILNRAVIRYVWIIRMNLLKGLSGEI